MAQDPHPPSSALAQADAATLRGMLQRHEISSVNIVTSLLERIDAIDSPGSPIGLRSVIAVAPDALQQAAARDRERAADGHSAESRPLHGVPVLVKDNIEAVGLPGTAGATSLLNRPVARDAELVAHLRAAGAIVLGSTNLSEWANIRSSHSTSGWSAVGGLTANPWACDRSAGGSSSGSGAAVAAGLAPLAVGTETDGSIVCPASLNGVVGIKPTVGSVSRSGVVPISGSQDSPGPLARTVADAAALLDILMGAGNSALLEAAATSSDADLAFGALADYRTGHPATDELFTSVVAELRSAGLQVAEDPAPAPPEHVGRDELTVLLHELVDDLSAHLAARVGAGPRSLGEVIAHEREHAAVELAWFGHDLFESAAAGGGRRSEDYQAARSRNLAWALGECLEPALSRNSVLIAPAYAPAWKSDLTNGDHGLASPVTRPAAIAGYPIGCLPMGLVQGLPVGIAVIAPAGGEVTLVRAMAAIEAVLGIAAQRIGAPPFSAPARG